MVISPNIELMHSISQLTLHLDISVSPPVALVEKCVHGVKPDRGVHTFLHK